MFVRMNKTILLCAAALLSAALSLAACGGTDNPPATGYTAPTLSSAKIIAATPDQSAEFLGAEGGLGTLLLFESETGYSWTDRANMDVYAQYKEAWTDSGWEAVTSFSSGADLWQKDDLRALSLFFFGVDAQQALALEAAGIEPPPIGSALMVAHVWDPSKPLSSAAAEEFGWTPYTSEDYDVSFIVPPRSQVQDSDVESLGLAITGEFGNALLADADYAATTFGVNVQTDDPKDAIIALLATQPDVVYGANDIHEFTTSEGNPAAQVIVDIQGQISYISAIRVGDQMFLLSGNSFTYTDPAAWEMMAQPVFEMMLHSMK
jgi:hypothetical protein